MSTASTAALDSPIPIRDLRQALRANSQIELVGPIARAFISMACPQHEWNWPLSNSQNLKVCGFDAHQSCVKCASERLFDSRSWTPGPMFRKRSHVSRGEGQPKGRIYQL